jgi:hypothetical protein
MAVPHELQKPMTAEEGRRRGRRRASGTETETRKSTATTDDHQWIAKERSSRAHELQGRRRRGDDLVPVTVQERLMRCHALVAAAVNERELDDEDCARAVVKRDGVGAMRAAVKWSVWMW